MCPIPNKLSFLLPILRILHVPPPLDVESIHTSSSYAAADLKKRESVVGSMRSQIRYLSEGTVVRVGARSGITDAMTLSLLQFD